MSGYQIDEAKLAGAIRIVGSTNGYEVFYDPPTDRYAIVCAGRSGSRDEQSVEFPASIARRIAHMLLEVEPEPEPDAPQ